MTKQQYPVAYSVADVAARKRSTYRSTVGSIVDWNDKPERTKEEVIDFFKQLAKDLRNGATA